MKQADEARGVDQKCNSWPAYLQTIRRGAAHLSAHLQLLWSKLCSLARACNYNIRWLVLPPWRKSHHPCLAWQLLDSLSQPGQQGGQLRAIMRQGCVTGTLKLKLPLFYALLTCQSKYWENKQPALQVHPTASHAIAITVSKNRSLSWDENCFL